MAYFCYFFQGLSPSAYWDLDEPEYRAMRRLIEKVHEQNTPKDKQTVSLQSMAAMNSGG
jgi:hypothetical protein